MEVGLANTMTLEAERFERLKAELDQAFAASDNTYVTLDADTVFNTSGFVNQFSGTFGWSLDPADRILSLTYTPTPVPEPGTLGLVGIGMLAGLRRAIRPPR